MPLIEKIYRPFVGDAIFHKGRRQILTRSIMSYWLIKGKNNHTLARFTDQDFAKKYDWRESANQWESK